jgi:hypothetical protein
MPDIQLNMLAIGIAVIAHFVLGFLWYMPLFGKIWGREMGYDPNEKPKSSEMIKGMVFNLIGNFFLVYVFSHNIAAWDPRSWGLPASEASAASTAMMAAVFTWLGFYFPVDLGSIVWDRRSWTLFFINTAYHLVSLLVVAFILVYMSL